MKYENVEQAVFLERRNRFVAMVEIDGKQELCHVKNTGRCEELFVPGTKVWVERNNSPDRKTAIDLITVEKDGQLFNVDSQVPNKVVGEWIQDGGFRKDVSFVKSEKTYLQSRFDFYIEAGNDKIFMEVKGVNLVQNQVAMFPDAPTKRGIKHVLELCQCKKEGYDAYVVFLIQTKGIRYFTPNRKAQESFLDCLLKAEKEGVHILAYDSYVNCDEIKIGESIPVCLNQ